MSSCRPKQSFETAEGRRKAWEAGRREDGGKQDRQRGLKADGKAFTADANRAAAAVRCFGFLHFGPR